MLYFTNNTRGQKTIIKAECKKTALEFAAKSGFNFTENCIKRVGSGFIQEFMPELLDFNQRIVVQFKH